VTCCDVVLPYDPLALSLLDSLFLFSDILLFDFLFFNSAYFFRSYFKLRFCLTPLPFLSFTRCRCSSAFSFLVVPCSLDRFSAASDVFYSIPIWLCPFACLSNSFSIRLFRCHHFLVKYTCAGLKNLLPVLFEVFIISTMWSRRRIERSLTNHHMCLASQHGLLYHVTCSPHVTAF
jgi:hypothetical protein